MRRSVGGSKTRKDDEAHHSMRSGKGKKPKAPRATGRTVKVSDKKGGGMATAKSGRRSKPRIRPARRGRPAF